MSLASAMGKKKKPSVEYEIIENILPENYRVIRHSSSTEMNRCINTFVRSMRYKRDSENVDNFLKAESRVNCSRVDAIYTKQCGVKSHIEVKGKDEYWAEQEKLFPYLEEVNRLEDA